MGIVTEIFGPMHAIDMVKNGAKAKFVESVDVAINLNVSKKAGNSIKTYASLPHSVGRNVRVAVFTDDPISAGEALHAGAEVVGDDNLLEKIASGNIAFDVLVTSPRMMPRLSKVAKILGPKGLMPNAKLGTLTDKIIPAVNELKAGRVDIKSDEYGTVHVKVGNVSMSDTDIVDNIAVVMSAVTAAGTGIKGFRAKSMYIGSTMGKGYGVDYALLSVKK